MIGTRTLAPALAALLLVAAAALAQPGDDTAPAAPAGPPQASPAPKSTTATDSAGSKPGRAEKSPSDYRSSEEISEDLPVSFPVDI